MGELTAAPQAPQLLGLFWRLVHAPLQQVSPSAHCISSVSYAESHNKGCKLTHSVSARATVCRTSLKVHASSVTTGLTCPALSDRVLAVSETLLSEFQERTHRCSTGATIIRVSLEICADPAATSLTRCALQY